MKIENVRYQGFILQWYEVPGAESYKISIKNLKDSVFGPGETKSPEFNFQGYGPGKFSFKISPVINGKRTETSELIVVTGDKGIETIEVVQNQSDMGSQIPYLAPPPAHPGVADPKSEEPEFSHIPSDSNPPPPPPITDTEKEEGEQGLSASEITQALQDLKGEIAAIKNEVTALRSSRRPDPALEDKINQLSARFDNLSANLNTKASTAELSKVSASVDEVVKLSRTASDSILMMSNDIKDLRRALEDLKNTPAPVPTVVQQPAQPVAQNDRSWALFGSLAFTIIAIVFYFLRSQDINRADEARRRAEAAHFQALINENKAKDERDQLALRLQAGFAFAQRLPVTVQTNSAETNTAMTQLWVIPVK